MGARRAAPRDARAPDSLVARGRSQKLAITMPRDFKPDASYLLVADLDNSVTAEDAAFVAHRKADINGAWLVASADAIADFMKATYPSTPRAFA